MPDDATALKNGKVNILLVDDQRANLLALEAVLDCLGQHLVKAQSGAEALKCLLDGDFAVILMDVLMPAWTALKPPRSSANATAHGIRRSSS